MAEHQKPSFTLIACNFLLLCVTVQCVLNDIGCLGLVVCSYSLMSTHHLLLLYFSQYETVKTTKEAAISRMQSFV